MRQTFEATNFWRGLLEAIFGFKERIVEMDGLSLVCWQHPIRDRLISTPYRDRLALQWQKGSPHLDLEALARALPDQDVVLKDCAEFLVQKEPASLPQMTNNYVNTSVQLDDALHERFKRSAKKNIRRAREVYGLETDINPPGVIDDFYALYLKTRQRLGVVPYPRHFFEYLLAQSNSPVVVFRCRAQSSTLGYLWCYLHDQEMISAHIAYDFSRRNMRISDFLFVSAFEWGMANGRSTYRFGADNANQTSLIKSKEKLGAVARKQFDYSAVGAFGSVDNPNAWHRRILRNLPQPVFRKTSIVTRWHCD